MDPRARLIFFSYAHHPPEGSEIDIACPNFVLQGFILRGRTILPFGPSHSLTAQFASLSL